MGLGLLTAIKSYVPFILYIALIFFVLRAMTGRMEMSLALLTALIPLRNVIDKLHVFPLGKDIVDIFLIALLFGLFIKGISKKDEKIFQWSPINPFIIILVFFMFISVLQGSVYLNELYLFDLSNPRVQMWKNFCVLPILFFVTYNGIKDKKWVWRIIIIMCLTMAFMDMYLLGQIALHPTLVSRTKIKGTFVFLGPNEIGAFYTQYTVLLIGLYFYMKKSMMKLLLLGLILLNLFCILFLFSRAAYVAIALGLFVLFLVKKKVLLIPLILVAIFWQIALPDKVQQRIEMTTGTYGELDKSSRIRLYIWEASWRMFEESPIIGAGYGVFSQMGYILKDTHNIYLKILAEQGLFGMMIFLLLLFVMFLQGIKLFTGGEDDMSKGLGFGYMVCIFVLMINNFFGDRWTYMTLSSNFWILTGLVARLNYMIDQKRTAKEAQANKAAMYVDGGSTDWR